MKNPFKNLGGKIKTTWNKMKISEDKKAELRKNMVDSFGDGCCIGGLTLLGAAVLAPVATGPTLVAASLFLAVGGTAKYTAAKMKPNGPTLEKALPPVLPPADPMPPSKAVKPAGPGFRKAIEARLKQVLPPAPQKPKPNPPVI